MSDLVAEYVAGKAAHAVALARPMIGVPMRGDPFIADRKSYDPLFVRRACQYATSILQRDPQWSGDLSHLKAAFYSPDSVIFTTPIPGSESGGTVVAQIKLPQHVMDFNPAAMPIYLRDG